MIGYDQGKICYMIEFEIKLIGGSDIKGKTVFQVEFMTEKDGNLYVRLRGKGLGLTQGSSNSKFDLSSFDTNIVH